MIPLPAEHLLPEGSTALEKVFAASGARTQQIPTPIEAVKRPYEATAEFLPFAGWEYSVDVWFSDWPETTKRNIAARSLQLHQKKGTLYCIKEYVRYAGGTVLSVERAPQKVFSGPSLTRDEREAWLSQLPQVRVWLFREEGAAPVSKAFYGGYHPGRRSFFPGTAPTPSTALSRLHRRARWVVDGAETDVRVSEFGSYFRLHLPSVEGLSVFSNRPVYHRYFIPSEAWRRLVTIQPTARLPWRSPDGPTLQPVTSEPERVRMPGTKGYSVFSDLPCGGYFVPSSAKYRIFDRYAVHDGRRVLRRPAVQFMGTGRYGFPQHTAWLRISVPGHRSAFAAGEGIAAPGTRFWLPRDPTRLDRVRRAIQSAKRLSDKVMLDIGPVRRFVAGRPFLADIDHKVVGLP